jgi:acyl-CoA synthetase (AMP-forming)/AMP-acid ligase II
MAEFPTMLNLLCAASSPAQPVGWRQGEAVAREEFLGRVRAWRALLMRQSKTSFALYLDDCVEFASALFGAWQAGKTIYLPGDKLPGTCAGLSHEVQGYLGEFAPEYQPLVPLKEDAQMHGHDWEPFRPDFVGLVLYTSGTTGAAQAIPKTIAQMSAEVATLERQFGSILGAADIVATVSHQHIYGLLFQVLWPLTSGRAIHARSLWFFEELITKGLPERDWVLVSSPAHLKRLPQNLAWGSVAKRLRAVFSSGGPLPLDVAQQTQSLLHRVPIEIYGSSETGGIAWRQQRARADELWTPFPGVKCRIDSQEGVLEIRSPHLSNEDWYRTADRALTAANGCFLLKGRVDRIAKIEGKRISLSAIEALLTASPMVGDARVIAIEDRRQKIAAFIALSTEGRRKLVEVGKVVFNRMMRERLRDSVEPVGLPRIWRYLDALPVNAQGKTTHAELMALLEVTQRPTLPLQRLLAKDVEHAVFELIAPRDLLYFDGHFPNRPILPGVVQVNWAIYYARQCFDLPPSFRAIRGLKFQRVISPEMPFTLELVHEPSKCSLSFKISSHLGSHSHGRILFGAADV